MKINKFIYGWKLYVNYGSGWEYETFEDTYESYKANKKAYAENCNYPQKWTRSREINSAYSENLKCEHCNKIDSSTRFESYTESNVCDSCLNKIKLDDAGAQNDK